MIVFSNLHVFPSKVQLSPSCGVTAQSVVMIVVCALVFSALSSLPPYPNPTRLHPPSPPDPTPIPTFFSRSPLPKSYINVSLVHSHPLPVCVSFSPTRPLSFLLCGTHTGVVQRADEKKETHARTVILTIHIYPHTHPNHLNPSSFV